MPLTIQTHHGQIPQAAVDALADLRIVVFREWPYLYEGDRVYEAEYVQTFLEAPDSVLVLAKDGGRIVGASTGMPMLAETKNIQEPWQATGFPLEQLFYFSESVLLPEYRGQGVGRAFFAAREEHARALGRFTRLTFCGVERPAEHPLRPADHVPLDGFWHHRGFRPTDLRCYISWLDVDQERETSKPLRFWEKEI